MILTDGAIGQMMEKVQFKTYTPPARDISWATTGKPAGRQHNYITSLFIQPERMEQHNLHLEEKFRRMRENELLFEEIQTADADYLLVAYGLSARICRKAIDIAREKGIRVGLLRPITLYPFPYQRIYDLAEQVQGMLSVELNSGQMVEDVQLAVKGRVPVQFYGRLGGMLPTPEELVQQIEKQLTTAHAS